MPCCTAIVWHRQCQHQILLKLRCTEAKCDDRQMCPLERPMLVVYYNWSCERCLIGRSNREDEGSGDQVDRRVPKSSDKDDLDEDVEKFMIDAAWEKDDFTTGRVSRRRIAQLEEVQNARLWTHQFGMAASQVLFPEAGQKESAGKEEASQRSHGAHEDGKGANDDDAGQQSGADADAMAEADDDVEDGLSAGHPRAWLNVLWQAKKADVMVGRVTPGIMGKYISFPN